MMATQKIDLPMYKEEEDNEHGGDNKNKKDQQILGILKWNKNEYSLYLGENILGKNLEKCDIILNHTSISDIHCEINFINSNHAICKDLRSTNGTFIEVSNPATPSGNNTRKQFMKLKKGQQIKLLNGINIRLGLINLYFEYSTPNSGHEDDYDIPSSPESTHTTSVHGDETTQYMPDDDEFLNENNDENNNKKVLKKHLSTVHEASAECEPDPYDVTDDETHPKPPQSKVIIPEEEPTQILPDDKDLNQTEISTEDDEPVPAVEEDVTEIDEPMDAPILDESETEGDDDPSSPVNYQAPPYYTLETHQPPAVSVTNPIPRTESLSSYESQEMTHDNRPIIVDNDAIKLMLPTTMLGSPSLDENQPTDTLTSTLKDIDFDSGSITFVPQNNEERPSPSDKHPIDLVDTSTTKSTPKFTSGLKRFIIADDDDTDNDEIPTNPKHPTDPMPLSVQSKAENLDDTQEQLPELKNDTGVIPDGVENSEETQEQPQHPPVLDREILTDPQVQETIVPSNEIGNKRSYDDEISSNQVEELQELTDDAPVLKKSKKEVIDSTVSVPNTSRRGRSKKDEKSNQEKSTQNNSILSHQVQDPVDEIVSDTSSIRSRGKRLRTDDKDEESSLKSKSRLKASTPVDDKEKSKTAEAFVVSSDPVTIGNTRNEDVTQQVMLMISTSSDRFHRMVMKRAQLYQQ